MVDIKPLQSPSEQNKSSKWINLFFYYMTKLQSQDNIYELSTEVHLNGSLMCGSNVCRTDKLHGNPSE